MSRRHWLFRRPYPSLGDWLACAGFVVGVGLLLLASAAVRATR